MTDCGDKKEETQRDKHGNRQQENRETNTLTRQDRESTRTGKIGAKQPWGQDTEVGLATYWT